MYQSPAAFPSVAMNDPGHPASAPGMNLRDYFAGQALAGFCANPSYDELPYDTMVRNAYDVADAMLQASAACRAFGG